MVSTLTRCRLQEFGTQSFSGSFPTVPLFPGVDPVLLTASDDDPMFVTLVIAETGRVSANGLVYDEALVSLLEKQLQGKAGIRGHIPESEISTAYPVNAVYWVGALREGNKLWAKGYVPSGATRDDIRMLKAIGGEIGTSIFGTALQEMDAENPDQYYAREFELEGVDLAQAQRAALYTGGRFTLTAETKQQARTETIDEEDPMADTPITIHDVPQTIREQIAADAIRLREQEADFKRLKEQADKASGLEKRVSELTDVITKIQVTVDETDPAAVTAAVAKLNDFMATLKGVYGDAVTVDLLVQQKEALAAATDQLAALEDDALQTAIGQEVVEMTSWHVTTDDGKNRVQALRQQFTRAILGELAGSKDRAKVKATAQAVWDKEIKFIAEAVQEQLSGGRAAYGGSNRSQTLATPAEVAAARARVGF